MSIPIVFVHTGNPFYLKYTLKQARYFNPDSPIYLLGDESNDVYPFLTHVKLEKYKKSSTEFANAYKHRSTNNYDYELFCFERWFCIKDFLNDHNIDSFIYLDSDVLSFYNFSNIVSKFANFSIANTGEGYGMPAFTFFSDRDALNEFCDFALNYYINSESIKKLDDWHYSLSKIPGAFGGVCDMTLFDLFFIEKPLTTKKIDLIGDIAFDVFIRDTSGYEAGDDVKKVYWKNNLPYCKSLVSGKLVQFATLHYQGDTKRLILKHYKGKDMLLNRATDLLPYLTMDLKKQVKKVLGLLK